MGQSYKWLLLPVFASASIKKEKDNLFYTDCLI